MADQPIPGNERDNFLRPRSRGRPRVRSPESARRFQRECIRQMQATRVYLGTAYQRWRSLSFMFKRTSDMAKHLLDVHERHCTVCYHPSYAAMSQMRRTHDSVRLLSDFQRATTIRSQLQRPNDASSSLVSVKQETPDDQEIPSPLCNVVNLPLPSLTCVIKKSPESDSDTAEEAMDLTTDNSGTSAKNSDTSDTT